MKTRIKEHTNTWFDTTKGKKMQRTHYTVQYKRGLFWRTVCQHYYFCTVAPVHFPSRKAAEKCREYIEQTGNTWYRV